MPLNSLWIPLLFDNSAENIGKSGSYAWYGPGWAHASAAPFRLYKAYPTEGGYRVPTIVAWPGRLPVGSREAAFLTVSDLAATLLDFGGVVRPVGRGSDATVAPRQGSSFRDRLTDSSRPAPDAGRAVALEVFGRRAVRRDQWKALQLARPFGTGSWELFDLDKDPGERHDLATSQPAVLAGLIEAWDRYAGEVGVVLPEGGESAYGVPDLPVVQ